MATNPFPGQPAENSNGWANSASGSFNAGQPDDDFGQLGRPNQYMQQPGGYGQPDGSGATAYSAQPVQVKPKKKGGCVKWGLIILGVFVVLGVITQLAGGNSEKSATSGIVASTSTESASAGDSGSTQAPSDTTADNATGAQEADVPKEYKNALRKAESYSKHMHMSKNRIYDQLTSEYGEKFSAEAAQYGIDNVQANWNDNALQKARSYQDTMSMSSDAIYEQLISEYGEKFLPEEAQYAIDNL